MAAKRETVTIVRKAKVDKLKPTAGATAEFSVKRCFVLPRASQESGAGWVQVAGFTVIAPAAVTATAPQARRLRDHRARLQGGHLMADRPPPKMGPGRRVVFRPDHSQGTGFGGLMRSDQIRDVTEEVAHDIAARAKMLAPRRKSGIPPDGTAMADQFKVKRDAGVLKVSGNIRVKVEVFNSARSAAPNEFGGKRNARHRMLGRAGAEFGDFKPDGGPDS